MDIVTYDGHELTRSYIVTNIRRGIPYVNPNLELVGDRGRYAFLGSQLVPPTISFTILAGEMDVTRRREAVRELAPILLVDRFVRVSFSSDDGRYYMAIPQGEIPLQEFVRSGRLDVTMTCDSAAMYGRQMGVTVPSGGSVTFNVGGNDATRPRIKASAAVRDGSSGVWGVRLDGADVIKVPLASSSSRAIEIDCESRTCKVAGVTALPTLDSDWMELGVGRHTLTNHLGSGQCVVTWDERWV